MNSEYDKTIHLNGYEIENKEKAIPYLKTEFDLPSYTGNSLDAIADSFSEVKDRVEILLTKKNITYICDHSYAFKVLMMLGNVVNENPNLYIFFRE